MSDVGCLAIIWVTLLMNVSFLLKMITLKDKYLNHQSTVLNVWPHLFSQKSWLEVSVISRLIPFLKFSISLSFGGKYLALKLRNNSNLIILN